MYTVEENTDFAKRHGGNEILVDGKVLFPSGASMDSTGMMRAEPPTEPVALLKAKKLYLVAMIKKLKAAREKFKGDCLRQAAHHAKGCAPPPPATWKQQLDEGATGIAVEVQKLVIIEHELAKHPQAINPGQVWGERQQQKDKEVKELISAIQSA